MAEVWRPVVGAEHAYEVSDHGRVRRANTGHVLRSRSQANTNTQRVNLSVNGVRRDEAVHRLVLDAFVGVESRARRFRWLDGDKSNNALSNLEELRGKRCTDCRCELTEENGYLRDPSDPASGLRSLCRTCTQVRRRRQHDAAEDVRRSSLPDKCEICGRTETVTRGGKVRRPTLDHCHETGRRRGVLCSRCNTAIGMFLDDPDLMRSAASYIEKYAA